MKSFRLLVLALAVSIQLNAFAQSSTPPADTKKAEPAKTEDQKKAEEYDKFIKDLKKVEGQFSMYQKGRQLFLELPEAHLGKQFLVQATWSTGAGQGLQAGDPTNYGAVDVFRFDKVEDKVWLVKPARKFRWSKDDPLALASERSFPDAVLSSFTVSQTHPARKVMLFDVTNLFYGDVFRLGTAVNLGLGGQFMLDREKSGPAHVKSFPKNTVVQMNLYYQSQGGGAGPMAELMALLGIGGNNLEDARSAPLKMTYNLWLREETDYRPRLADPRVGYFTEDFYSVDRFLNADRTERYIQRWNLKKKDPKAALSEPVKPIVWTLDPSIPPAYREAVRKGILYWNKAYEKLGYKDAIRVQDAPDDKDYDHADGRYNVIRWTMTPDAGYAVALFRSDPFTGEILNAAVTFDANMLHFAQQEALDVTGPSANARQRAQEVLLRREGAKTTDEFHLWASDRERAQHQLDRACEENGWQRHACRYGHGLAGSASFAYSAALAGGLNMSKEDYAKQFITDVVSHEVGHCLGLRHNFIASTNLTVNDLANDQITNERGITASVMDYTPANIVAALRGARNFYTPTIGVYDVWAVRYGYMDVNATTPLGERFALDALASQSTQPGLAFMTDENADSFNPYVARFDCAKDPIAYSEAMFEAAKRVRRYAIQNLPRPGESPARRTTLVMSSIGTVMRQGQLAARFLGGVAGTRHFTGKTLAPAPADDQRRAMKLISACLSPEIANLPADIRQSLSRDMSNEDSSTWIAPLRDVVGTRQTLIAAQILSASAVDRIAENAFKWGKTPGAYTMDEHYRSIVGAVYSEVGKNTNVDGLRRDLQRFVTSALITQAGAGAGAVNDDARMLAADNLRSLSNRLAAQIRAGKTDGMTTVHYRDMKSQIDRFLSRQAVGN